MARMKFSRLELQILEALWAQGKASIREIQEAFPEPRPAYTTVQTTVYRLEAKDAVRRVRKISNAHIFEPIIARDVTRSITNKVIGGIAADLGKSVGGSLGSSIGRSLVRGALGGLLRR